MKLYKKLAMVINALENCKTSGNEEWYDKHLDKLEKLVQNYLPSGSGINTGCTINNELHKVLLIYSGYHTIKNDMYDRWIDFTVKVTPSLQSEIDLLIKGNFRRDQDIKEYLYDEFNEALRKEVE